jgi:DNA mismatch repair protein MutS
MAGKSTYLRQIALIVVLAQMGSFVPANQARVGIVDRVFTRIGAADDLAGGVSTFMLEMQEAATICRQATPSSLVVLDEIGRGTSSAEGAAIAQAVIEYLHQHIGPRMLFSTHFHQLPEALATLPRLELWTFSIIQLGEHLAFTHRITPGVAELSYGVHTARLAGLPENVLVRALALLDVPELAESGPAGPPSTSVSEPAGSSNGLSLAASQHTNRPDVLAALAAVDVATTTPLEALLLLAKWQAQLRGAPSRT